MTHINPKSHDSLFKWLIAAFTEEFFQHYFLVIRIGKYQFIDKEFIQKYEALKESLKGDLFLMIEVEIDSTLHEIVICIEHQSEKEDVSKRVFQYACYAWLLKEKPVWSMVIYTDDAIWRKDISEQYWFGFDSENKKQYYKFNVIKVNVERSVDLIQKHSLFCKLLSLKANDKDADVEALIRDIYKTVAEMKDKLDNDKLLLINQWVDFYRKVPQEVVTKIKEDVKMEYVETTISEHIFNQGMLKGLADGKTLGVTEGEAIGEIKGEIKTLENLYKQKVLSKKRYQEMVTPLKQQLQEMLAKTPQA